MFAELIDNNHNINFNIAPKKMQKEPFLVKMECLQKVLPISIENFNEAENEILHLLNWNENKKLQATIPLEIFSLILDHYCIYFQMSKSDEIYLRKIAISVFEQTIIQKQIFSWPLSCLLGSILVTSVAILNENHFTISSSVMDWGNYYFFNS